MKIYHTSLLSFLLGSSVSFIIPIATNSRKAIRHAARYSSTLSFLHHPKGVLSNHNQNPTKSATTRLASLRTGALKLNSKDTDETLPSFYSREEYFQYLSERSGLPQGFSTGISSGSFVSVEAPNMGPLPIRGTVVYLDEPTDMWAATFTSNKFPGAPIIVGKKILSSGKPIQALVINNKVSNVCSGTPDKGVSEALQVCEAVAKSLNLEGGKDSVLPSSTGVIGWRLPAKELAEDVIPEAVQNLQSESALSAAEAICTTDRYPKLRSKTLTSNGARIIGIAKGAGMIEPNMATMLCYIFTDAKLPSREDLQKMLTQKVNQSFNSISVDGDESTSDTTVLLSSQIVDGTDMQEFEQALGEICQGLASDLVRNGEGTSHVMRVKITNFPGGTDDAGKEGSDKEARKLGRHIVNSPLFKCAIAGNDPNTGRLAGAIGSFLGKAESYDVDTENLTLSLGGRTIFQGGKFVLEGEEVERELSLHMQDAQFGEIDEFPRHQKYVEIGVHFNNDGSNNSDELGEAVVIGSDLTAEYVAVNADYRS